MPSETSKRGTSSMCADLPAVAFAMRESSVVAVKLGVERIYWPKPDALDGKWKPPTLVKVP